ncbi:MAG: hypothetical protein VXB67_15815, partial [Deltaproteobacteria bacterium]
VVGLGSIQVAKAVAGHIGQINPVAGSDRFARVVIEEVGLGSGGTTPTDADGLNPGSGLHLRSIGYRFFNDWCRIAGDRAGITWIRGLQHAAGGGQRYGEEGDEPFHDLSPLLGAKLNQRVDTN